MTIDTIIYHGNCQDGFCAAFLAAKRYPDADLVAATYGKPVDDRLVRAADVLVVDFSWPRAETLRLQSIAKSMVILDHHKTAEAELSGLDFCVFDMNRSGAQLSWDWNNEPGHRPWYVDYVADRDLWRYALPHSKEINGFIGTLPFTVEAWSALDAMVIEDAYRLGTGALAKVDYYVRQVAAEARDGRWGEHSIKVVNAAYPMISDVANQLCIEGAEVGIGWFVRGDGMMQFSLRSIGDLDVSVLTKELGGGGHRNAAGFQVPFDEGLELLEQLTHA
jgi:uncharacterized protein